MSNQMKNQLRSYAVAMVVGFVFAVGLGLSGMTQPANVVGFLDVTGDWRPQLAVVMAAALAVYAMAYRQSLKRSKPVFAEKYDVPTARAIDGRLLGGAVLFGIGWGIAGLCPGPALVGLGGLLPEAYVFVVGMTVGIFGAELFTVPAVKPTARPSVHGWFDPATSSLTYAVYDPETRDAVVIDPVANFDAATGQVTEEGVTLVAAFLAERRLKLHAILETHAHADHLSGAQLLKRRVPHAPVAISARISIVQEQMKPLLTLPPDFATDGSQFDLLLKDHQEIQWGSLSVRVIPTPGHTPSCSTFLIGDAAFSGDTLFMPDAGTGRCDFPGGDAATLYRSIKSLYALTGTTRIYVGHDYQPGDRPLRFETTVAEERRTNIHLNDATTEADYVAFRNGRDLTLTPPKLMDRSLRANLAGGATPAAIESPRNPRA